MKIRVLGCSGGEFPGHNPPALVLDDRVLFDAGTVGVLALKEQLALRQIFITHSHLDHVRALPLLADTILLHGSSQPVEVWAVQETEAALKCHLFNNIISPDFTSIPEPTRGIVRLNRLESLSALRFDGYEVMAIPVHHSVPAVAYFVRKGSRSFLYTGDTGPTDEIWRYADGTDAVIVESSFPNRHEELARITGHLTPRLLELELQKMATLPRKIYVTHLKPQFHQEILGELMALGIDGLEALCEQETYEIGVGRAYVQG